MTLPKNKKLKKDEIDSIKKAIDDVDIRAVHPDKLEELAEYMKNKMSEESDNEQEQMG
tara:strand:- start:1507 stop:1680 length:174 start_codon:yes stop_codon:yes gene_type:complete